MPCMNTCCCCFNTYQGSLIIGVLSLLPGITGVVILSHYINTWDSSGDEVTAWAANVTADLSSSGTQLTIVSNFIEAAAADMHTVCVVLLIYFVGSSLTALMLISGVYQRMRCLMLPWLTVVLLRMMAVGVSVGIFFYVAGGVPEKTDRERLVVAGLGILPELAFTIYWWLCVFSHYHQLQLLEEQVAPAGEEEPVQMFAHDSEHKY